MFESVRAKLEAGSYGVLLGSNVREFEADLREETRGLLTNKQFDYAYSFVCRMAQKGNIDKIEVLKDIVDIVSAER